MLDPLDWLDLASWRLTTLGHHHDNGALDEAALQRWRSRNSPAWRPPTRELDALAQEAGPGCCALTALTKAAALLDRTDAGWRLPADPLATVLLRWRLPLGTAYAAAAAAHGDEHAIPLLPSPLDPRLVSSLSRNGVVDGHIHVGASMPFDALFALVVDRLLRDDRASSEAVASTLDCRDFHDADGMPYSLGLVLATSAVLWPLLHSFATSDDAVFVEHLAKLNVHASLRTAIEERRSGSFLETVEPLRVEPRPSRRRIDAYWAYIAREPAEALVARLRDDGPIHAARARKLNALLKWHNSGDAAYGAALGTALRCESVLHHSLTQSSRIGLDEFLLSSRRLGQVRRLAAADKTQVVRHGLEYLAGSVLLHGVELRTAEQAGRHETLSRERLANRFDELFRGYEQYIAAHRGSPARVSWPLCLIRDRQLTPERGRRPTVSGGYAPRFELRPLWEAVVRTAELLGASPSARALIPGIDIAGDEKALPSWCAWLLFDEFREQLSRPAPTVAVTAVTFRVHAGEDFDSPLQGLRRISEAAQDVVPTGAVPRIGHALALGSEHVRARHAADTGRPRRDEAFDDLVWAWHMLSTTTQSPEIERLTVFLRDAISQIGPEIYPLKDIVPTVEQYWSAYRARFDRTALAGVGLLVPSVDRADAHGLGSSVMSRSQDPVEQLLAQYLTDHGLDACIDAPLIDPARTLQIYDELRPLVVQQMCARGSVIEVCPTSNVVIGGIAGYGQHPMFGFLRDGLAVTLNTDDPGVFGVSLLDEYAAMWSAARLSEPAAEARIRLFDEIRQRSLALWDASDGPEATQDHIAQTRAQWRAQGLRVGVG